MVAAFEVIGIERRVAKDFVDFCGSGNAVLNGFAGKVGYIAEGAEIAAHYAGADALIGAG